MAQVHSDLPAHAGELRLARTLAAIEDDHLHLWFGVNFIPGVPDIDVVIWHEDSGVFCVEVKAVGLDALEEYGWKSCKIAGRGRDQGPHQQANRAVYRLLNYLGAMPGKPFITAVACWPEISRRAWNQNWDEEKVCGRYASSMIMEDDLYADPLAFQDRLKLIRLHPNIGLAPGAAFIHSVQAFKEFRQVLNVNARPVAAPTDYDKLRILEQIVTGRTRAEAPVHGERRIVYSGRPGTGKTFRLLQIAMFHAMEGCDVLFVCFNKVLATDIRRLLGLSERIRLSGGSIEVHDVYEVLELYAGRQEFTLDDDYKLWAELVVGEMKENPEVLPKYDTVLVDEGQDMPQWAFEMLDLHSKPGSTICVAAGDGQELYGDEAPWLGEFRERTELKRLRRVFRNPRAVFQLATLCYETDLNPERIDAVIQRFGGKGGPAAQLTFDRGIGDLPRLVAIDDSSLAGVAGSIDKKNHAQNDLMVDEYARIIRHEADALDEERRLVDLLLLVSSRNSPDHAWVTGALERLDLPYIDYTVEPQRRYVPSPQSVRLCTYHSSRGIEGERVIVFGLEQLQSLAGRVGVDAGKLGYIALSRAVIQMVIPYRRTATSPVIKFVQQAVARIRGESEKAAAPVAPGMPRVS